MNPTVLWFAWCSPAENGETIVSPNDSIKVSAGEGGVARTLALTACEN